MSWLWLRGPGRYKGYRLEFPPGMQEAAIELLLRHDPPRSPVLDLASGGAMLARLSEAGFSDLHAVARDPSLVGETEKAVPEEWNVASLDLNRSISVHYRRRFGLVVSSEVIEHLDSPREFLREVYRLLEEDGYLLLTTPNVANWVGRIWFVLFGELRWFDDRMYRKARHISPITNPSCEPC